MIHTVYQLEVYEFDRYRTHLLSLDPESRYLRFGYHANDDAINKLCNQIDENAQRHRVFVIEDNNLKAIAAGHISLEDGKIELAFSVLKQYQGKGMGSALMKRCIEWCQNRGIKGGCMVCLSHNTAVRKLAEKHGILINEGGETLADIKIPSVNPISIMNEVVDANLSKIDHLGKLQRKFTQMVTFPLRF
jgi:GNAT superfamily N-acetyltransferase